MNFIRCFGVTIAALVSLTSLPLDASALQRAIWVTRWDFKTPEDIATIFQNTQAMYATDVYFQVRGSATAYYKSDIEPWAWELTSDSPQTTGNDPGWDPLAVAIREAKATNQRIHAWINVMPAWRGRVAPPESANQLWTARRNWIMVDHAGGVMWPPRTWYTFVSPGIPEVQAYLKSVVSELASRYPEIDGIHLDYIRYPGNQELNAYRVFSFDPVSKQRFRNEFGKEASHTLPEWNEFKRNRVAEVVGSFREVMDEVDPSMELSATHFADLDKALFEKGQDPLRWMNEGLVNYTVPMAYSRSFEPFKKLLDRFVNEFPPEKKSDMSIGLLADQTPADVILRQIEYVQQNGFYGISLFAYSSFFTNHQANSKVDPITTLWKEDALKDILLEFNSNDSN